MTRNLRRYAPIYGPVAIFAAATTVHVLAMWPAARFFHRSIGSLLVKWDGAYYLALARGGYPTHLPSAAHAQSTAGFYPLFPAFIRGGLEVTPFGERFVGVAVAVVFSAAAMVVLWQLTARLCNGDGDTAYRAVALTAFAPGAFVLSMVYSEGMLLFFASLTLLMLLDDRWLLAGLFAAGACLARPTGVAAAAACAVAAFVALRANRRDWKPLLAPAIAAIGFVALPVYDQVHMGDALAYWKTQKRGWHEGFDFGLSTVRGLGKVVTDPGKDFNRFFAALGVAILIGGIVLLVRWRPPAPVIAYAAVVAALTLGASSFSSTLRFVLVGFPFTIAYARVLKNNVYSVVLACSAVLFATLAIASASVLYTP